MVKTFDQFNIKAIHLENSYNEADTTAEELIAAIDELLFLTSKKQKVDVKDALGDYAKKIRGINDPFMIVNYKDRLAACVTELLNAKNSYHPSEDHSLDQGTIDVLERSKALLKELISQERPNFFRIGYYALKNPNEDLTKRPVAELNAMALKYLDDNFMNEFLDMIEKAVRHSHAESLESKKALLEQLAAAKEFYLGDFTKRQGMKFCKNLSNEVEASIDRMEIIKDSAAYTFRSSLSNAIKQYFYHQKRNPKEERRFEKQSAKRDRLIARGKKIDWQVLPKNVYDTDELKENITLVIERLIERYTAAIAEADKIDFDARCVAIIDFLKEKASQVVYRVTKTMAKEKAIKLMEEVGIHEPRTRYYQYPFEFSGGMRQRIVIAIALAANPDILICDEPTTALDVTIQAQILELINNLKKKRNLSVIFITHDLGVVANMADDIAVMYAGKIVEYGTADDIFYDPRHPYTWALLSSMPDLDTNEKLDAIPGTPPNMIYPPVGDAFAARNKYAMQIDFEEQPPMFDISDTHKAATWLLHPDAPKVDMPQIITDRIARMKSKSGGEQHVEQ